MKSFAMHIWHTKDDGSSEDLSSHTVAAVDLAHAEYLVRREVNRSQGLALPLLVLHSYRGGPGNAQD